MRRCLLVLMAIAASGAPVEAADDGRYLYTLHCSGCHVRDGSGSEEGRIPRIAGTVGHFQKVPEGRRFILQVPGVMNSGLADSEVASLMNWLVPHFAGASQEGAFAPYTSDEVRAARQSRPDDIFAARRAVAEKLKLQGVTIDAY